MTAEDMRKEDTCVEVAPLERADCFDNDGRRRVLCEKGGSCCETGSRGNIREGRDDREDAGRCEKARYSCSVPDPDIFIVHDSVACGMETQRTPP